MLIRKILLDSINVNGDNYNMLVTGSYQSPDPMLIKWDYPILDLLGRSYDDIFKEIPLKPFITTSHTHNLRNWSILNWRTTGKSNRLGCVPLFVSIETTNGRITYTEVSNENLISEIRISRSTEKSFLNLVERGKDIEVRTFNQFAIYHLLNPQNILPKDIASRVYA